MAFTEETKKAAAAAVENVAGLVVPHNPGQGGQPSIQHAAPHLTPRSKLTSVFNAYAEVNAQDLDQSTLTAHEAKVLDATLDSYGKLRAALSTAQSVDLLYSGKEHDIHQAAATQALNSAQANFASQMNHVNNLDPKTRSNVLGGALLLAANNDRGNFDSEFAVAILQHSAPARQLRFVISSDDQHPTSFRDMLERGVEAYQRNNTVVPRPKEALKALDGILPPDGHAQTPGVQKHSTLSR